MKAPQPIVNPRRYATLRLDLHDFNSDDGSYLVTLTGDTVGELQPVEARLHEAELRNALDELDDGGIEEPEELISFGAALADRLLPLGPIRTAVTQAIDATGSDDGVRLRLVTREPRLAQLPWEYTYLRKLQHGGDAGFLVLDPRISLVRHEALALPHTSVAAREPRGLRLVAATANAPNLPELDLRQERRVLDAALRNAGGDLAIDRGPTLTDPTVTQLRNALTRGADVFHFAGHGESDEGGYLALPAEDGLHHDRLYAGQLAQMLRQAGVRVAVLSACRTGRRDGASPWQGISAALIEAQIPAVVAMQYRIGDTNAISFTNAFYTSLAAGLSVDEAVTTGRLAGYQPDGIQLEAPWGIPVLYSRSPDGLLFPDRDVASLPATKLRVSLRMVVDRIEKDGIVTVVKVAEVLAGDIQVETRAGTVSGDLTVIDHLRVGGAPATEYFRG